MDPRLFRIHVKDPDCPCGFIQLYPFSGLTAHLLHTFFRGRSSHGAGLGHNLDAGGMGGGYFEITSQHTSKPMGRLTC